MPSWSRTVYEFRASACESIPDAFLDPHVYDNVGDAIDQLDLEDQYVNDEFSDADKQLPEYAAVIEALAHLRTTFTRTRQYQDVVDAIRSYIDAMEVFFVASGIADAEDELYTTFEDFECDYDSYA